MVDIILLKLSEGKKPPPEIKVMLKFKELKSLTPDTLNKVRQRKVSII